MKRYSMGYDYTVLIDDDLFVTKHTNYEGCFMIFETKPHVGCVTTLTSWEAKRPKDEFKVIDHLTRERTSYNVNGGMVFSKESIKEILEYFKDKECDYSEDMFWLLLYVKGYDLYRYMGSMAIHRSNMYGISGELTGFSKMRCEKPYNPILPEYYHTPSFLYRDDYKKTVRTLKVLKDINQRGLKEREENIRKWQDRELK